MSQAEPLDPSLPSSVPATKRWHDSTVANAATAWLRDPRDYVAYQHLVAAVDARNAFLNPQLDFAHGPAPEPTSDPQRIGDAFPGDPGELLARLRGGSQ
ncbi:hypothetical protein [Flexivirga caeni]|uniref:hypothetical protein n=1 Tax=Flexivirga caeni TaxID=2294115 RepID=UPI0011CDAD23|nr:hypothetical protein [Flexivirga caeni]